MGNKFREKVVEEGLAPEVQEPDVVEASTASVSDAPQAESRSSRGGKVARGVGKVLGGDLLADKLVLRQIPLLILCLIFLLLMVGNRYRVESLSREKIAVQERINDLREHRIQMQKQYQKSVKISQIAEDLSQSGVGITSGPPYEIEK